jgi:hypothetical protein
LAGVEFAADRETGFGCSSRDQFHEQPVDDERLGAPVLADEEEEAVLDFCFTGWCRAAGVRPIGEAVGFVGFAAPCADEPIAPTDPFKVSGAIRVVTKEALELRQRTRKWQICVGQDDGGHDGISFSDPTLPIVSLGVCRLFAGRAVPDPEHR